ncbi:MAG: hypothetical protein HZA20_07615 [Nitrospirae bacterium]|jgi:sulfur transfer complex TusBCD TusB component (DsrH family)|nr:hypothetical protein [Nitrospirota bacterium]
MTILHLLNDPPSATVTAIIEEHRRLHDVTVRELFRPDVSYDEIVRLIESHNRVFTW